MGLLLLAQFRKLLSGHGGLNSRVYKALRALIADSLLYLEYFSNKVVYSKAAEQEVVPPDRKPLPNRPCLFFVLLSAFN